MTSRSNGVPRVAVVVSHPIQHYCPFYRRVAEDTRIDLRVFFASSAGFDSYRDRDFDREVSWGSQLLEGFRFEFLPGAREALDIQTSLRNQHLPRALEGYQPNAVVIYGLYHHIARTAFWWSLRRKIPRLYIADSSVRNPTTPFQQARKHLTLPWFFRGIDVFLTVGDSNEAYYRRYGADPTRFVRCPYPFEQHVYDRARANAVECRRRVRERLQIDRNAVVALVVGKLTVRKSVDTILDALATLREPNLVVVLAGDGPERASLKSKAEHLGVTNLRFAGFVHASDLPEYYVASDVLLHPSSHDPHPLAVTEAIAVGLPVIVSSRVGSIGPTDDARPGENAVEFPFGDAAALAHALRGLLNDPRRRQAMGSRSLEIAHERSLEQSVQAFVSGVTSCVSATRRAS